MEELLLGRLNSFVTAARTGFYLGLVAKATSNLGWVDGEPKVSLI